MKNFPKLAAAVCAITMAFTGTASAQFLQLPPSAMVDNSVGSPDTRPPADSTPLVDNSVDNSVRTVPPGLINPNEAVTAAPETTTPAVGPAADYQFISGGISEEGRDGFLAQQAPAGYNAKMLFTGPAGNLLADVDVVIKNAKGEAVVTTKTDGPLLLAKLPRGAYKIEANYKGEVKRGSLNVGKAAMASSVFRFANGD